MKTIFTNLNFNTRKITLGIIAILSLAVSTSASAAIISYTNWSMSGSNTVIPIFKVSDDPAGKFQVDVSIDTANSPNDFAQITGIYFDLGDDVITDPEITYGSIGGPLMRHTNFVTNNSKINGVTNLNLGDFEVILGYKDGSQRAIVPITFFVDDNGLTLADWGRVGVRFQSVGETGFGQGSDKEVSTSAVPIPAAVWLFGSALMSIIGVRRSKKT